MSDEAAPSPPDRRNRQVQRVQAPLPPVDELERYEALYPGITERLFAQWEAESAHRREMERTRLEAEIASEQDGRRLAFYLSLAFLLVSAIVIALGIILHQAVGTITGGVLGGVDLVALAYVFILGKSACWPTNRK